MGPHIGALGEGLMPGGQQIDITDQPVTTAREAQPARRADGWLWVLEEQQEMVRGKSKEFNENKDIMTETRDTIFVYFQKQFSLLFSGRLHM